MGEAFLVKTMNGGYKDPVLSNITITPNYHTSVISVQASDGSKVEGVLVSCNDGGVITNSWTNVEGRVKFLSNSGIIDVSIYNYGNNFIILDQVSKGISLNSPINKISHDTVVLEKPNNPVIISSDKTNCIFLVTKNIKNVALIGGGGGGGGGSWRYSIPRDSASGGGGGGGGAVNFYSDIAISSVSTKYNLTIGAGGKGANSYDGSNGAGYGPYSLGNTGGTTSAFGQSAIGGKGGFEGSSGVYEINQNTNVSYGNGGVGTYNGGHGGYIIANKASGAFYNITPTECAYSSLYAGGGGGGGGIIGNGSTSMPGYVNWCNGQYGVGGGGKGQSYNNPQGWYYGTDRTGIDASGYGGGGGGGGVEGSNGGNGYKGAIIFEIP